LTFIACRQAESRIRTATPQCQQQQQQRRGLLSQRLTLETAGFCVR